MGPQEKACLLAIAEHETEDANLVFMRTIQATTGLGKGYVRRAVRSLARKGLLELSPAFDWEGMLNGSGYGLTAQGHSTARFLNASAVLQESIKKWIAPT